MAARRGTARAPATPAADAPATTAASGARRSAEADAEARRVWSTMCDLVLTNVRRKEAADAAGLSFGKVRALRRLARRPMSMGELAGSLGMDAPNATVLVDDLETRGLVRRRPHPTDRRARVVEITRQGRAAARRADAVLGTPPPALDALDAADVAVLGRILARLAPPPPEGAS